MASYMQHEDFEVVHPPVEYDDVLDTRSNVWQKAALFSVCAVIGLLGTSVATAVQNAPTYMPISGPAMRVNTRPNMHVRYAEEKPSAIDALEALTEAKPKASEPTEAAEAELDADGNGFIDEMGGPKEAQYSDAMKAKLRAEYLATGGDVNSAMPNYFLNISLFISILAIATWATGNCAI